MAKTLLQGTNAGEPLIGTSVGERIEGLGGGDRLEGRGARDLLFGGKGSDTLDGGGSADTLKGGAGADLLVVSAGSDKIFGGGGNDTLDASTWDDGVWLNLDRSTSTDFAEPRVVVESGTMKLGADGDSADWTVQTVTGIENFKGSASRDWISSGSDWGKVTMGAGDDFFVGDTVDLVKGGAGDDRLSIRNGKAVGGNGDDVLSANPDAIGDATLLGGAGNDSILLFGNDAIGRGGKGDDIIAYRNFSTEGYGGPGSDVFEFNSFGGGGIMRDFEPGRDKIDITGYSGSDPTITWDAIQDWWEPGETGVRIRLDSQRFSNQTFEFTGLSRGDLSEDDFIL